MGVVCVHTQPLAGKVPLVYLPTTISVTQSARTLGSPPLDVHPWPHLPQHAERLRAPFSPLSLRIGTYIFLSSGWYRVINSNEEPPSPLPFQVRAAVQRRPDEGLRLHGPGLHGSEPAGRAAQPPLGRLRTPSGGAVPTAASVLV